MFLIKKKKIAAKLFNMIKGIKKIKDSNKTYLMGV